VPRKPAPRTRGGSSSPSRSRTYRASNDATPFRIGGRLTPLLVSAARAASGPEARADRHSHGHAVFRSSKTLSSSDPGVAYL
jgi:hypothetical protein